jgi:hypothetical protein
MASPGLSILGGTSGGDPNFRLDVGSVLARTFAVWAGNLIPFFLVGVIVQSPVLLALGAIELSGASMPTLQPLLNLLSKVLTLILTGGVTYGVFQHLRGERASLGDILRLGLSRLGTVWGTAILTGLAIFLGFCALIVPAFILMARFWVSVPVAVIEEPGATAAMGRSAELTEGSRWRVLAVAVLLGVIMIAFMMFCALALGLLAVAMGSEIATDAVGATRAQDPAWAQGLLVLLLIPLQTLNAVAPAIAYHDLRIGKEGADVEELLRVFE